MTKALGIAGTASKFVLSAALFAAVSHASALCTSFTPAMNGAASSYSSTAGCQAGGMTISNISYLWASFGASPAQDPGAVTIGVDTSNASSPELVVTAQNNWIVSPGSVGVILLFYSVGLTNPGSQITGGSVSLSAMAGWDPTESGISPGSAGSNSTEAGEVSDFLALLSSGGPTVAGSMTLQPAVTNNSSSQLQSLNGSSGTVLFSSPQSSIQVHNDIVLSGGDSGFHNGAEVTQIRLSLVDPPAGTSPQPEPDTFFLLGGGLLTVALLWKKRLLGRGSR